MRRHLARYAGLRRTFHCHWWKREGAHRWGRAPRLLVLADSGGSNSCRSWAWKTEIQARVRNHNANMTLLYVEVTQQDLQREYQAARIHPRHLVPPPPALQQDTAPNSSADASAVQAALTSALRLMDLHRQLLVPSGTNEQLLLLSRRLTRIRTLFEKLSQRPAEEK